MDVTHWFEVGFLAVLQSAVVTIPVFLLVWIITGTCRRWLAPWARQTLWSLVLVRLLLPVSLASPMSMQLIPLPYLARVQSFFESSRDDAAVSPTLAVGQAVVWAAPSPDSVAATASHIPAFDWLGYITTTVVPGILFPGMLLVAIWTGIATVQVRRWARSGSECAQDDWWALLREGQQRFKITGAISMRTVPGLTSPATCGWLRPTILLPEDATTWSALELRHVIWHELAHIRRHDIAMNWGLALVRVLHWWNPVFWWAQRMWLAERELACDALALRKLDGSQSGDYGRTLLRFLERLTTDGSGLPSAMASGFVLFLGRKWVMRRRFAELPRLARSEGRWRCGMAVGLIVALGAAGLTDAARPRAVTPRVTSIELPAGTTWSLGPDAESQSDQPRFVATYDVSDTVDRLRRDDPELTAEMGALSLGQSLQQMLQPHSAIHPSTPSANRTDDGSLSSRCVVAGSRLVVSATKSQHEQLKRLLERWTEHGQRQICIESNLMTTALSLKEILPGAGGDVLSARSVGDAQAAQAGANPSTAQAWTQHSVPTFVQVLGPHDTKALIEKLHGDRGSNRISSPKITLLDGQAATIQCGSERPFVTGLRTRNEGEYEPQVSWVVDGFELRIQSQLADDELSTQLEVQYIESKLLDVEILQISAPRQPVGVQIPHVFKSAVRATAIVPAKHSLLIAPLHRDPQGQLHLCLIQPRSLP